MGITCKCIDRQTDNSGKLYYTLQNNKGKKLVLSEEQLKTMLFTEQLNILNMELSDDGELIDDDNTSLSTTRIDVAKLERFFETINKSASREIAYLGSQVFNDQELYNNLYNKYFKSIIDELSDHLNKQVIIENGASSIFFSNVDRKLLSAGLCTFYINLDINTMDTGEAYAVFQVVFQDNYICNNVNEIIKEFKIRGAYTNLSIHKILGRINYILEDISSNEFGDSYSWPYIVIDSKKNTLEVAYNNEHEYYHNLTDYLLDLASPEKYIIYTNNSGLLISGNEKFRLTDETSDSYITDMLYKMLAELVEVK